MRGKGWDLVRPTTKLSLRKTPFEILASSSALGDVIVRVALGDACARIWCRGFVVAVEVFQGGL